MTDRPRLHATDEQRRKMQDYLAQGYTMATVLEDGSLCPGYSDWVIEYELDMRDLEARAVFHALQDRPIEQIG